MVSPFKALVVQLRDDAEHYRKVHAHVDGAVICTDLADRIESITEQWWIEELTLQQAADERGLSYDTVQRKVSNAELPNVGRKHAPRVRRCDLYEPSKPTLSA